jgi:hypothetical protein
MLSKRLATVVSLVTLVGVLAGCSGSEPGTHSTSPTSVVSDVQQRNVTAGGTPETAGSGLKYTLVPNEDLTSFTGYSCKWHMWPWQMGPNYTAIDEVTDWNGNLPLDSLSVGPWTPCQYMPDSWGFSNIGTAHPGAVIASIDVSIWVEATLGQWEAAVFDLTLFLDGQEVDDEVLWTYDSGISKLTATFTDLGALAKINSMEVELQAEFLGDNPYFSLHAMSANVFAYVPGKQGPRPYVEP